MIKKGIPLLILVLLFSCGTEENKERTSLESYFDLTELLDEKVDQIVEDNASLEKLLTSGDKTERLTIEPGDTSAWKSQLRLFYDSDINKPGYIGAYFAEELPALNQTSKVIYTAKSQKYPVRVIECIYEQQGLREVRLLVKESNTIYDMTKEMNLYFDAQNRLSGFRIKGDESMQLKKALDYSIEGTIVYSSESE